MAKDPKVTEGEAADGRADYGVLGLLLVAAATVLAAVAMDTNENLRDSAPMLVLCAAGGLIGLLLIATELAIRAAQDVLRWRARQRGDGVDWYR